MVEQGFPNSHTTTTAVQPDSKPSIYMDLSYLRTKIGMLKCGEIVSNATAYHYSDITVRCRFNSGFVLTR